MNFYLDTEFIEHAKQARVMGFPIGRPVPTVDLISIGVVADSGSEYYAISNEFDVDAAWSNTWVRFNVLEKIHDELCGKQPVYAKTHHYELFEPFTPKSLKHLIKWHGKSRREIAMNLAGFLQVDPVVYGYFADYDWVVLCQLFGRMADLPQGFPYYCRDLKQMMDERGLDGEWKKKHCPGPADEHNAIADARWNMKLHQAILSQ